MTHNRHPFTWALYHRYLAMKKPLITFPAILRLCLHPMTAFSQVTSPASAVTYKTGDPANWP